MVQKVTTHGYRVGVFKDWDSRWIAKKYQFADYLVEDDKIRKFLKKKRMGFIFAFMSIVYKKK